MANVFAHALSGVPVSVQKSPVVIKGYIIRDMLNFLYVTNTTLYLNKWREIEHESDLFWVISEKTNPFLATKIIVYKTKEIAEEHRKELLV
jgi:hypothetical protein